MTAELTAFFLSTANIDVVLSERGAYFLTGTKNKKQIVVSNTVLIFQKSSTLEQANLFCLRIDRSFEKYSLVSCVKKMTRLPA